MFHVCVYCTLIDNYYLYLFVIYKCMYIQLKRKSCKYRHMFLHWNEIKTFLNCLWWMLREPDTLYAFSVESLAVVTMTWLTVTSFKICSKDISKMNCLCHKCPRVCSLLRNQKHVLSSVMTCHRLCTESLKIPKG